MRYMSVVALALVCAFLSTGARVPVAAFVDTKCAANGSYGSMGCRNPCETYCQVYGWQEAVYPPGGLPYVETYYSCSCFDGTPGGDPSPCCNVALGSAGGVYAFGSCGFPECGDLFTECTLEYLASDPPVWTAACW